MFKGTFLFYVKKVNVCVIGAGPSGIAAALRAADFGKTTCLIEKERIGGADFWNGALQSKTMWEMAKFSRFSATERAQRFYRTIQELPSVKHENIQAAIISAAETRERQTIKQLEEAKVEVLYGEACFVDPHAITVKKSNRNVNTNNKHNNHGMIKEIESTETIEADYFVIATGAKPRPHPTAISNGTVVLTSDDVMEKPLPKSVVIIGAGVIGCEFATIFANFGQTQVNVIEKSNRILPMEDEDISTFVENLLKVKGVCFHHNSAMVSNKVENNKFYYTLKNLNDNSLQEHVVDNALVSIGRVPNWETLNLKTIGAEYDGPRIKRDNFLRICPFRHIYACGDVATRVALVNVGELEARACVEHMYIPYPEDQLTVKLDNLSTIMFLDQEVAAVGLNEQQCRAMNIAYRMARYGYEFVGRALASGNTRGFVKIIVTNDQKKQVLGVRAIGPHASSVIELASLAIHNKESIYSLRGLLMAYPTITEGFQECLNMLLGSSTLKPNVFPQLIVKEWDPPTFDAGRVNTSKETLMYYNFANKTSKHQKEELAVVKPLL